MNIKSDDETSDKFTDTEPSYEFTGPIPDMDPGDYWALERTPKGMKPIVDPETRVCIGYYDKKGAIYDYQGVSIGDYNLYDPPDSNIPVEEVLLPLENQLNDKPNIIKRVIKKASDFFRRILYLQKKDEKRVRKKIFDIKGENGTIHFGIRWVLSNGYEKYYFCYENNDLVFVYQEILDGAKLSFEYFKNDLRGLLLDSSYFRGIEILNRKPDSWFKQLLRMMYPSWFSPSPIAHFKDVKYNAKFMFFDSNSVIEIKKNKDSSGYIIKFQLPDPYPIDIDNKNKILFQGSLLVSEEALINFYQELASL